MDILMVSPEVAPYLVDSSGGPRDGGLGASVTALSRALTELGHSVTLAAPNGTGFSDAGLLFARRLTPLVLPSGEEVVLFDGQLPSGVRVTLFESPSLESRSGAYGDGGKEYPDNKARMGTLCQAASALAAQAEAEGSPYHVVHAHGWAAAALPVLTALPTVLTVYNAEQQGGVILKDLSLFGIPDEPATRQRYRLGNRGNLLKGGMLSADWVTTQSASYATSMLELELTGAFGAALKEASLSVLGIAGGIDYAVFNPATDAAIPVRFDAEAPQDKGRCKAAWLRELGIDLDPERPLLVFADGLDKGSGASWLPSLIPKFIENGAHCVVVGTGSKAVERQLSAAKLRKLPGFRYIPSDAAADRRRALAAADIALCASTERWTSPAIFAAQRYGAVPVAYATPAACDAIVDCSADLSTGTGFLFDEESSDAVYGAVARALSACTRPGWGKLRRRVMRLDLGWDRAARRYEKLYRTTVRQAA